MMKSECEHEGVTENDPVKSPPHYKLCGIESKDIIKLVLNSNLCAHMTPYQHACMFSVLKYRMRAGKKSNTLEDIAKSIEFESMSEE